MTPGLFFTGEAGVFRQGRPLSSVGRAHRSHRWGRWFESSSGHQPLRLIRTLESAHPAARDAGQARGSISWAEPARTDLPPWSHSVTPVFGCGTSRPGSCRNLSFSPLVLPMWRPARSMDKFREYGEPNRVGVRHEKPRKFKAFAMAMQAENRVVLTRCFIRLGSNQTRTFFHKREQ